MRCLYCGKQLPLLKKLTGGGEFCSEAHRQKYQEEYNKLALSRLLQTQNVDSDAPHRGELVLASRQHPALQAGRPPLRALEAPKSTDSPLTGNWTPGANRTQRALPPPSNPSVQQPSLLRNDIPKADLPPPLVSEQPSSLRPFSRTPTTPLAELPRQESPRQEVPRPEPLSRFDPANRPNGKRDAFTFRPIEPFPVEKAPPPPPVSTPIEVFEAPPLPAPEPVVAAKALEPAFPPSVTKEAPPEAAFIVEEVRKPEPPAIPNVVQLGNEAFTDGRPPKPAGWARWEPDIQEPPGRLDSPDLLLPLSGPPGTVNKGDPVQAVGLREEQPQERQEIKKRILENQVKPGDFKQTVPTAPSGPATVLPICPPAAALERVLVTVLAKAPTPNPALYLAPAANGEDLWTGWSRTGIASVRICLTLVAPEVTDKIDREATPRPVDAVALEPAKPPSTPAPKPLALNNTAAKPPVVETSRNYKAAEALKSAAQAVVNESAPKAVPIQQNKPSTPRHEVFVDLSVLGIEEDEDADAEFVAQEGESPPGEPRLKVRRKITPVDAVRELVSLPHRPSPPSGPKLARSFQAIAWKHPASQSLRLVGLPLRPKVVFEQTQAVAQGKQEPTARDASSQKASSSLASAWSAKRLKKVETGAPPSAPGNSGPVNPVETPVSESSKPVSAAPPVVETARIDLAKVETAKIETGMPKVDAPADKPTAPTPVAQPLLAKAIAKAVLSKPAPLESAASARTNASNPEVAPIALTSDAPPAAKKAAESAPAVAPKTDPIAPKKAEAKPASVKKDGKPDQGAQADEKITPPGLNAAKSKLPEPPPQAPPFEAPILGAGVTNNRSFWANLPVLPKIALALGLIATIAGGAWFMLTARAKGGTAIGQNVHPAAKTGRSLMMNLPGGWSPDWGGDFNRKKNRTISFYRPSINNEDYRMEFEGQVDSKAVGWVFRAVDSKNYYACKIEFVKTGPDPGVALTHFTIVNGVESQKHYSPLLKPIRSGVAFHVRLDVRGDEFSAYINDELIEVWQDDRLKKGGFGLMTELGETGQVRKLQVYELMP